ncbi:MAG: von Willebrand factor type A domain-containing protein [Clostridia bacterium]|nr:von Willebrand factor type A domain-containing protein [Clostridia bacterium]
MKTEKILRILSACLALCCILTVLASCADAPNGGDYAPGAPNEKEAVAEMDVLLPSEDDDEADTGDSADDFVENPFIKTETEPVSTFSADVDTASYAYFRKLVNNGNRLSQLKYYASAFRTEEFLNYFRYDAEGPAEGELFGVTAAIVPTPWNESTSLLRLTLQAEDAVRAAGNNLVFLIDVSGSMASSDKLELIKRTFSVLVGQLNEFDRVSIVTYSGKEEVVLRGCPGSQSEKIMKAINGLRASGSTNGHAGLEMAYSLAADYFIEGGSNRIIMASDGDLNVGISSADELKKYVETKRDQGIYLSVMGFGTGNYKDNRMEALADNGNGVYYYIDGEVEAEKVFGTDLFSTLYTVAGDVKLQLTFDPAYIKEYRLIGYENRVLANEDFENDRKDAGEVGAGHQVTVFYELTLNEEADAASDAWMKLAVRYKKPGETVSVLNEYTVGSGAVKEVPDADTAFMTAVIGTTLVLHGSKYKGDLSMKDTLDMLDALDLTAYPDREGFRGLIRLLCE